MSTITKTCHEKVEKPERSFFLLSFFFQKINRNPQVLKAEPYLGSLGTHTALGNAKANITVAVMPLFCLILWSKMRFKADSCGKHHTAKRFPVL